MEGFQVEDYQGFNTKEIDAMFKHNQLDMLVSRKNTEQIYVKYLLDKPLRKDNLNNIVEDLFENPHMNTNAPLLAKTDTLVVIIEDEPNETNVNHCRTLFDRDGIFVVVFNIRRLQFNVRKHSLNPQIRILTTQEMNELKQTMKITDWSQLPEISRFDPLAMSIFLKPGQILHIDRDSPVSISSIYYRYCV